MNSGKKVDILMATYNGATYLEDQLKSILEQTYENWHLFIRDDGSTDGTTDILNAYTVEFADRISIVRDEAGGQGAAQNFSRLMRHSDAEFVMFSDQDDIWESNKVAVMVEAVSELEKKYGQVPLYVFSDLTMVDDNGTILAPSLWKEENLDPGRTALNQLLVQNVPYGCATIINRPLLKLAWPIDKRALLHDHWMALLASAVGVVDCVPEATIRHRIHDSNASRSKNPIRLERQQTANAVITNKNFNRYFGQLEDQARAVKERLLERNYSKEACEVLDDFINLRELGLLARKRLMIKRKFFKHSKMQSLKWLVRI